MKENVSSHEVITEKEDVIMSEMATWRDDASRTYYFLKGYASNARLYNMQKSLILAKQLHEGQYRKGGAEYLVHPLRVCNYLLALGFIDDVLLSAALLHDVIEDVAEIRDNPNKLIDEYGISAEVVELVGKVTKLKSTPVDVYYAGIAKDFRALLIKLSDRCNNVSTMECFTLTKMKSYIEETKDYVLPLCAYSKLHYPEYNDQVTIMKYQITALCSVVERLIPSIEGDHIHGGA